MEISPQHVRSMSFSTVKRGYDSGEVDSFVQEVAAALETAQNETTAMEARARAAVARLQELSQGGDGPAVSGTATEQAPAEMHASVDETETISRTLLLAQRTADTTVAEAEAESERLLASAREDAGQSLDQARQMADQLVEDAKEEARRAGEGERIRVETEVQALNARRDFLESDVDQLEAFLIEQRERIRESAAALSDIVERVPGGLGTMRRPLLSAAGDDVVAADDADDEDDTAPYERPGVDDADADGGPDDREDDRGLDELDDRALDDLDSSGEPGGSEPERGDERLPLDADADSTPSHSTLGDRTVDERRW